MKIIVFHDKTFIDGPLVGVTVPDSRCTYPDVESAMRDVYFLKRVERENDFIRQPLTGNRFKVSNVAWSYLPDVGAKTVAEKARE